MVRAAPEPLPAPPPSLTGLRESSLYLVLGPDLTIVEASDAYRRATLLWDEAIQGSNIFDVFPDNPHDAAADGVTNLRQSFREVLRTGWQHRMAVQQYDVRDHVGAEGWVEKHWLPTNYPVFGSGSHEITHVIHQVVDVTRAVEIQRWVRHELFLLDEQEDTLRRMRVDLRRRRHELGAVSREVASLIESGGETGTIHPHAHHNFESIIQTVGAPRRQGYFAADDTSPANGIYVTYHRQGCDLAPTRIFVQKRRRFPRCPTCRTHVLYRLLETLDLDR